MSMTSGPRRYRAGYRNPTTGDWVVGVPEFPDATLGYYDPDADQWAEGMPDIQAGQWLPENAMRGTGARDCPPGFPVKGNLPSRVYHVPGQATYERTTPEICFASDEAAAAGGFRPARGAINPERVVEAAGAAAAGAAAAVESSAREARAGAPTPPAPPPPTRPVAPPPPPPPNRNWLWWLIAALIILGLLWYFFLRPQPAPVVEVTPEATVAAPAATSPEATEAPAGIVASPTEETGVIASPVAAVASPVAAAIASPVAAVASPIAAMASPVAAASPVASPVAEMEAMETQVAGLGEGTPAP
jgi:hypothetical protein